MKEDITKAIKAFNVIDSNKKLMIEVLGEDNLKNYPFSIVKVQLAQSQSQGTEVLEVNLKTFRNEHYCDVAQMPEMLLSKDMCERIGKEMLKCLGYV